MSASSELLSTVKKRIEAVAADDDADSLDLSGLKISENELHRSLYEQDELLSLNLSGNSLTRLPPHIAKLNSLENLDVSNNSLTHLPFEIKYLTKLKNFKLEGNNFPDEVKDIIKAFIKESNTLTFAKAGLTSLAPEIQILGELLTELVLDNNKLTSLPIELSHLHKLEKLSVAHNELTTLEREVCAISSLLHLDVSHNKISRISSDIACLERLETLNISHNELNKLPSEVFRCVHLKVFNAGHNKITYVPFGIAHWLHLEELYLDNNRISALTQEMCLLPKVKKLHLQNNAIPELPVDIQNLGNVAELNLDGNKISYVYADICSLSTLNKLCLRNNQLLEVTSTVGLMPSLSRLLLKGNPNIKSPPHHLVEGKSVEAINYLKASASRRFVKDDFMRLVLIGDSGHGKSSLLSHLMFDSLEKSRSARGPLAVDWWDMKVPQQDGQPQSTIKFETWDLSCPAQALDLLRPMLSVRTTYLVVTRVNDTKNIPKWLNLINSKVSDPEILIVATHLDTYVNAADDVRKLQALYHDSARDVVGVSSAKKSINIPQLRTAIANSCIKNRYWSTIFVPQKWLALEENLAMEDESFLYLLNFEVLLSKCDIKKASQMIRAYRFLKERGRIIGPETAPTGQDVLVLHAVPLWSALTKLATTGKSQFTNAELDRVIGATDRQKLILLLKQLFLAVDRPDGSLLIPALISEEARVKSLEKANIKVMEYSANATLRQTFKFGTEAHTGIIREFALRMHNKAVVSDYDGSDYFAVHQTEKASAFVVREDSFTIHVYILKGAKGEDKDAISDLTNLMAEQLEHTFFAWKTYPIDYSYVESPVGHDGSYRPTSTRRGSGPKRRRDDSDSSESTKSGGNFNPEDGSMVFFSRTTLNEVKRRGLHYAYIRDAGKYYLVNPSRDLQTINASSLIKNGKRHPDFEHVTLTSLNKRAVAVVKIADGDTIKAIMGTPAHGLVNIQHKNVLPILGVDTEHSALVVDDFSSTSLADLIRSNPNELVKANYLKIAIDVAEGLAHLHSAKPSIVAHNVCSENIFVTRYLPNMYRAQVALFGPFSKDSNSISKCKTSKNIFAFGVILAEIFNKSIISDRSEKPKVKDGVPASLSVLVDKCCAPKPSERPSLDEVLRELYKAALTSSSLLRATVQADLEFAPTHVIVQRLGSLPLVRFLKDHAARDEFFDFLVSEVSSENLLFYESVQRYRVADAKQRPVLGKQMMEELIPKMNIPENIMQPIRRKAINYAWEPAIWDAAEREIVMLMENDTYKRFLSKRKN